MENIKIDIKTTERIIEDINAMYKKYIDIIDMDSGKSEKEKEDYVAALITTTCINFYQCTNYIKDQITSEYPMPDIILSFEGKKAK